MLVATVFKMFSYYQIISFSDKYDNKPWSALKYNYVRIFSDPIMQIFTVKYSFFWIFYSIGPDYLPQKFRIFLNLNKKFVQNSARDTLWCWNSCTVCILNGYISCFSLCTGKNFWKWNYKIICSRPWRRIWILIYCNTSRLLFLFTATRLGKPFSEKIIRLPTFVEIECRSRCIR